jgi:leucine efflux protein
MHVLRDLRRAPAVQVPELPGQLGLAACAADREACPQPGIDEAGRPDGAMLDLAQVAATFGVVELWAFVAGTVILLLLPGPNTLYVLAIATRRGIRAGYRGAAGIMIGDTVLMLAAVLGMGALLKAYPVVFTALKYVGGAYLAGLGATMLLSAWRGLQSRGASKPVELAAAGDPLRRALVISVLNPKAILFWMAFFIQFVDPAYGNKAVSFAILGLIAQALSLSHLTLVILAGARLASMFAGRPRLAAGMTGGAGTVFISFGAKLAAAG